MNWPFVNCLLDIGSTSWILCCGIRGMYEVSILDGEDAGDSTIVWWPVIDCLNPIPLICPCEIELLCETPIDTGEQMSGKCCCCKLFI